jgi:hypothetical protein
MPDEERRELRLALAMRGGVSLAVWIGGACAEIDELRRGEDEFWRGLLEATGHDRVVVDVLAGASAGGLNGVLFAAAIRHGFRMADLLEVWKEVASVDELRRTEEPWLSLFDGDAAFLEVIRTRLRSLIPGGQAPPDGLLVDLQLAATLVEPLEIPATSPRDEPLSRRRSTARFHFRHDTASGLLRRDLDDVGGRASATARLALAARATSSFPGAFEAAVVRSTRPTSFGGLPPLAGDDHLVDCRGVFSDARGDEARRPEVQPDDFVVADGGIVDNIPLGKAIDAIVGAPAGRPTSRMLLYLHPTGPAAPLATAPGDPAIEGAEPDPSDRRGLRSVLAGAVAAKVEGESIDGDLDQLEQHNRSARLAKAVRKSTLDSLVDAGSAVAEHWTTYRVQRPATDASRLRRLLDDPIIVLGEDPFPTGRDEDRWRAPLTAWEREERLDLDVALTNVLREQLEGVAPQDRPLHTGLGALRRSTDLLLEWARALPPTPSTGELKQALYRVRDAVIVADRARRIGWVVCAGEPPASAAGWAAASVRRLDELLRVAPDLATSAVEGFDLERLVDDQDEGLQALLEGRERPPGGRDLRAAAVEQLEALVTIVVEAEPELEEGSSALLLHRVLTESDAPVRKRIAGLEVICFPQFLMGSPGAEELEFARISAASYTPVAASFSALQAGARTRDDRARRRGQRRRWPLGDDFLPPDVKLAGNELSNFSAFLDPRWRENDWHWGRLDAASGLVDVLLECTHSGGGPTPELRRFAGLGDGADQAEVRRALIERRQEQLLAERFGDGWRDAVEDYAVGLETLNDPGSPEIQESLVQLATVGSHVLGRELPAPLRGVAWLARHAGRFLARVVARPRGEEQADGTFRRSGATPEDEPRSPGRGAVVRDLLWGVPVLARVATAARRIRRRVRR